MTFTIRIPTMQQVYLKAAIRACYVREYLIAHRHPTKAVGIRLDRLRMEEELHRIS